MIRLVLLMLLCLASIEGRARWATLADAPINVIYHNINVDVKKDGTSESIVEIKQRVLNEKGRANLAHYMMYYSDANSKLEIIEAKTINDGKEYIVKPEMIEDRPLASPPYGFDQQRQILISFPKIEVGSEIYIKYKEIEQVSSLDGFYASRFYYGTEGYWSHSEIHIVSALPLSYKVNDGDKKLRVTQKGNEITMLLIEPICREVVDGSENGIINDANLTWVSVSSLKDWKDLATAMIPNYEKVKNQPLPSVFKEIVAEASKHQSEVDQLNIVTSRLNEKVQYMGDWRTVHGRLFPRDLEMVAHSQIGDCKDFASSTAAMLSRMGYNASVSLVKRGVYGQSLHDGLPDIDNFNHAFVKVVSKTGKVYWIDPTNYISMANNMFEDIADKDVLVLDPKNPSFGKSGAIDPSSSVTTVVRRLDVVGDNVDLVRTSGTISLSGERAAKMSGLGLYASDDRIKDFLFYTLSGRYLDDSDKINMTVPDLKSRIVKNLDFKFEYKQDDQGVKTNMGYGLDLSSFWVNDMVGSAPDQVSDLFIGPPRIMIYKTTVDRELANLDQLEFHSTTSWMDVRRACRIVDGNSEIVETILIKRAFISSADIKTSEYKKLKHDLIENFQNLVVIVG